MCVLLELLDSELVHNGTKCILLRTQISLNLGRVVDLVWYKKNSDVCLMRPSFNVLALLVLSNHNVCITVHSKCVYYCTINMCIYYPFKMYVLVSI